MDGHTFTLPDTLSRTRVGSRQLAYALAACWLAILALAFQGTRGVWDPDEGRYIGVAQQMLQTGDFLVPQLEPGQRHLTKPPLTYWIIAASLATFGHNEWSARLPNALAFLFTGLLILWIGELLRLQRPWWPVAIWSTTVLPFIAANFVTTDSLLTLFETLAVAGFIHWRCGGGSCDARQRQQRSLWLMWIAFGLAFFVKGPPGLLPLLPILVFSYWEQGKTGLRALLAPAPIGGFLLIALWWFVYLLVTQEGLLRHFLVYEVIDRIATSVHQRNPGWLGLFEVYGGVAVFGLLPWSVPVLLSRFKPGWRLSLDWNHRLLLLWWLLPLLVFMLAQSRLPLYVLPLTVPFALWAAYRLERQAQLSSRTLAVVTAISAVLLVSLKAYAAHWSDPKDSRALANELRTIASSAHFERLVFLEQRPHYGLGFYLRQPISSARLAAGTTSPEDVPSGRDLCGELQSQAVTLFLVAHRVSANAHQVAATCSALPLRSVGHTAEFELLMTQPAAPNP